MNTSTGRTNNKTDRLRIKLLPQLAWKGIVSNGSVYYPYLAAGIFSVFIYFVFASILHNDIVKLIPKSAYMWILMQMGQGLLSIILVCFLIYANGFLIKRRRKEFGLYHILGLEKKHIGVMMLFETVILYVWTIAGGIIFGVVLSKLMFLLLLRICRLSADISFVFEPLAFRETLAYFAVVFLVNYVWGLWEVGKARPVELMSGSKKGEKEPRFLWLYAILGAASLGAGYYCSITAKVDSMIFINFFLAVFLVIIWNISFIYVGKHRVSEVDEDKEEDLLQAEKFYHRFRNALPHEKECGESFQYLYFFYHGAYYADLYGGTERWSGRMYAFYIPLRSDHVLQGRKSRSGCRDTEGDCAGRKIWYFGGKIRYIR